jgi:hypothetical protein
VLKLLVAAWRQASAWELSGGYDGKMGKEIKMRDVGNAVARQAREERRSMRSGGSTVEVRARTMAELGAGEIHGLFRQEGERGRGM